MSSTTAKGAPRAPAAAARKPRAPGASRAGAKGAAAKGGVQGGARLGRLGSWGWAALLGIGVVVLSPVVHAFWGDAGVLMLGIFGLGFLLGRWTAV